MIWKIGIPLFGVTTVYCLKILSCVVMCSYRGRVTPLLTRKIEFFFKDGNRPILEDIGLFFTTTSTIWRKFPDSRISKITHFRPKQAKISLIWTIKCISYKVLIISKWLKNFKILEFSIQDFVEPRMQPSYNCTV